MNTATSTGSNGGLRMTLTAVAAGCLLAGVAMGLLAIAGPVAVWLGMADFRMGFGLLQIVNGWAGLIAIVTALLGVGVVVFGKAKSLDRAGSLGAIALIGAAVSALSWYIPETFRPAEGTPAIHDIATNPDEPLEYIAIAPLRADAANNMEYGIMAGTDMTPAEHRRLQREAYPDIVPQRFEAPVAEVYERALAAAQELGWEIVDADPSLARIEATDTTFWFRFKDDVVIEITPDGDGSVLNARSLSRVGRSDVGKNAARLREFFSLLEG